MLRLFCNSLKSNLIGTSTNQSPIQFSKQVLDFGPLSFNIQKRWKKPTVTARTRLEDRTRDFTLDKLMVQLRKLKIVLQLHELMSRRRRGPWVSVQSVSKWRNLVGLNIGTGEFLRKYPHVFDIFTHPVKRCLCCKFTQEMVDLIEEEKDVIREGELDAVQRLKKLLMISTSRTLHIHALWLIRRELGLPDDFRHSLLPKYMDDFQVVDREFLELVSRDDSLGHAEIEKWRRREYEDKWLSEFETKYAFPINFPTGFKIEKGFREKLKNWQRLPYLKPYEKAEAIRVRTCGGVDRFEKRAVGILHELLSLTVDKMIEVERLSHFRRDFSMEVNVRELLLKHPGIFYISTKGSTQTVFLREAYRKGCLVDPNPIYTIRRKMLERLLMGCRHTRALQGHVDFEDIEDDAVQDKVLDGPREGEWVLPILECISDQDNDWSLGSINGSSDRVINEICEDGQFSE